MYLYVALARSKMPMPCLPPNTNPASEPSMSAVVLCTVSHVRKGHELMQRFSLVSPNANIKICHDFVARWPNIQIDFMQF